VTVLAVTGLAAEARIAARAGLVPICVGGSPERTEAALRHAIGEGVTGIVSFGIAGGLAPELAPGALILASAVLCADGSRLETSPRWRDRVRRHIPAVAGDVAGSGAVIATAAEKAALRRRTGAVATDLESAVVAGAARGTGLPFIILRAVADSAERDLPLAALIPLTGKGRPALPKIIASIGRDPGQIGNLFSVALDTRRALRALAEAVDRAGSAIASPSEEWQNR